MNLRTRIKLLMSRFYKGLNPDDAEQLVSIIEETKGDTYPLDCGATISTATRKTNEDIIRATVKCPSCCTGHNCRGISATVAGSMMMDCDSKRAVIFIDEWNKKQLAKIGSKK